MVHKAAKNLQVISSALLGEGREEMMFPVPKVFKQNHLKII